MAGILNRYILRQIWPPAVLAFGAVSFVMIAGTIQRQLKLLFKELPIAHITLADISWISVYALPTMVGYILPVTFLLGIMLAFGRMGQQQELTAMKAAGVSVKRIVLPVVVLGSLLSGLCFLAQDYGQSWANRQMDRLLSSELPLRATLDVLPTGVMHQYGDWRIYVGENHGAGKLEDIVVLQPEGDGRATAFYAESAELVRRDGVSHLVMYQGHYFQAEEGNRVVRTAFAKLEQRVPRLAAASTVAERSGQTLRKLLQREREEAKRYRETASIPVREELRKYRTEISERLSFPLMCLAVSLVATPIGARARRSGRSYTFASGLVVIGAYHVLRRLLDTPVLLPLPAVMALGQIPNIVLCTLGIALIWRVDRV